MTPDMFDSAEFVETMLGRGWVWGDRDQTLLVHPDDHELALRYDPATGRLTVSPELDEHLRLVIPTPPSRGRVRR